MSDDPFVHHPVLRDKIIPPEASSFRTFDPSELDDQMKENGFPANWRHTDERREEIRRETLAGRENADLWVFAYGSLMWNPGFHFAEVRRGRIRGYTRSFCLYDERGARGTREQPGLMAALDTGEGCDGLAFRIEAAVLEAETQILFRREMLTGVYVPAFVEVHTDHGPVEALTFVANHDADAIRTDLTRETQVRCLARGAGRLGTSLEYIENLAAHFEALRIDDPELFGLLHDAREYAAAER